MADQIVYNVLNISELTNYDYALNLCVCVLA